jgi:hypothetical protein
MKEMIRHPRSQSVLPKQQHRRVNPMTKPRNVITGKGQGKDMLRQNVQGKYNKMKETKQWYI